MKATEQFFPVVLFIMQYKVVLTFESEEEILKCDYSNESYWAVLSCGSVYYAVQGGSNVWVCEWNSSVIIQIKYIKLYFPCGSLCIISYRAVLLFSL